MTPSYLHAPVDLLSTQALTATGLRARLVDVGNEAEVSEWVRADFRGFHHGNPSQETVAEFRKDLAQVRTVGVYDPNAANGWPVGTVASWVTDLTLPGGTRLASWAISSVTVAPTHRRRGMATALLEGELRTARAAGVPLAILTVSESVIYGRWGFGPATFATSWSVDTKRVRWVGGATPGTLSFTNPDEYANTANRVITKIMTERHGEIDTRVRPMAQRRLFVPLSGDEYPERHRLVRYDSPTGEPEGFINYMVEERPDYTQHRVTVEYLAATSDRALRALWRYVLELDLVSEVRVALRGVDEPVHALVSDVRGAKVTGVEDHLWVRILDVPAVLSARRYEADDTLVFEVTDEQEFTTGRYRLTVTEGVSTVEATDAEADATLAVSTLGSLVLGHRWAHQLALAEKIVAVPSVVDRIDRLFGTAVPPRLSTWF